MKSEVMAVRATRKGCWKSMMQYYDFGAFLLFFIFLETRSCYGAQADFKLTAILQPQSPEHWDYEAWASIAAF